MCFYYCKYLSGVGYWLLKGTWHPYKASRVTIHGDIVDIPFFAVNGPSGTYYHVWKSLKLQSFKITKPNTWFQASLTLMGFPSSLPDPPIKAPIYTSKSSLLQSLNDGSVASLALTCPLGLLNYFPLTTIDEDLPW